MRKVIISVLGEDRPGIIAGVSKILFHEECNIENVNQTILQSEFSGIFIASVPARKSPEQLQAIMRLKLNELGLHIHVKPLQPYTPNPAFAQSEPFVITTRGPDRKGLVATITEVIAGHGVNVTHLQAVFKGGKNPNDNIMIYEVDVPETTDQQRLQQDLRQKAAALELTISIQHRHIFEALNRI
ncbi:MAG: amino acid-binding protein [Desulfobacterales bacterium]|nr:amino acid-binding protein [Desulfobacterales bacterium]